jgi:serine/threonine-protein kinase
LPEQLGRYLLERRLAVGGMAEVFLAKQSGPQGFEKVCVVKRMLPHLTEEEAFVAMFLDEARLAARLTHPNIAQIFDFGQVEDSYYLAMEYVAGSNLHRVIDDHARRHAQMPVGAVVKATALACAGLDFAHNATDESGVPLNIIHRDISPHNIMLSKNGDVKLIDFGIAKATVGRNATKAGTLKGKYAYMSPEQIRGQPLDRRTDIYAMGLVLWELLAGRAAVQGDSESALMSAAAHREFPPIQQVRPDVPPKVSEIIDRALAINVSERFSTAAELGDELEDYLVRSGTRVRGSELGALLSSGTHVTSVTPGTPSGARVLATPAAPTGTEVFVDKTKLSDSTAKELAETLDDSRVNAPILKPGSPESDAKQKTKPLTPLQPSGAQASVSGSQPAAPVAPRRSPAAFALGLVVLAAVATAVAYWQTRAPERPTDATLVVPPPPALAPSTPKPTEVVQAPKPPEPPPTPAPPEPAPTPVPPEHPTGKPVPPNLAKHPLTSHVPKPQNMMNNPPNEPKPVAPAGKGTVVFRVLPYAEVFQDGKSVGMTPLRPLELEPGKYSFKFVCSDTKKTETREVTVPPGGQAVLKVDLR